MNILNNNYDSSEEISSKVRIHGKKKKKNKRTFADMINEEMNKSKEIDIAIYDFLSANRFAKCIQSELNLKHVTATIINNFKVTFHNSTYCFIPKNLNSLYIGNEANSLESYSIDDRYIPLEIIMTPNLIYLRYQSSRFEVIDNKKLYIKDISKLSYRGDMYLQNIKNIFGHIRDIDNIVPDVDFEFVVYTTSQDCTSRVFIVDPNKVMGLALSLTSKSTIVFPNKSIITHLEVYKLENTNNNKRLLLYTLRNGLYYCLLDDILNLKDLYHAKLYQNLNNLYNDVLFLNHDDYICLKLDSISRIADNKVLYNIALDSSVWYELITNDATYFYVLTKAYSLYCFLFNGVIHFILDLKVLLSEAKNIDLIKINEIGLEIHTEKDTIFIHNEESKIKLQPLIKLIDVVAKKDIVVSDILNLDSITDFTKETNDGEFVIIHNVMARKKLYDEE